MQIERAEPDQAHLQPHHNYTAPSLQTANTSTDNKTLKQSERQHNLNNMTLLLTIFDLETDIATVFDKIPQHPHQGYGK